MNRAYVFLLRMAGVAIALGAISEGVYGHWLAWFLLCLVSALAFWRADELRKEHA